MTEMPNLVDRLQDGYRDKSFVQDLQQEGVSNVFCEESKRKREARGNIDKYELSETVEMPTLYGIHTEYWETFLTGLYAPASTPYARMLNFLDSDVAGNIPVQTSTEKNPLQNVESKAETPLSEISAKTVSHEFVQPLWRENM